MNSKNFYGKNILNSTKKKLEFQLCFKNVNGKYSNVPNCNKPNNSEIGLKSFLYVLYEN